MLSHCSAITQFRCEQSNECIFSRYLCDGYEDCKDGSDEHESRCGLNPCSGKFFCQNNQRCIPLRWCCDPNGTNCDKWRLGECCKRFNPFLMDTKYFEKSQFDKNVVGTGNNFDFFSVNTVKLSTPTNNNLTYGWPYMSIGIVVIKVVVTFLLLNGLIFIVRSITKRIKNRRGRRGRNERNDNFSDQRFVPVEINLANNESTWNDLPPPAYASTVLEVSDPETADPPPSYSTVVGQSQIGNSAVVRCEDRNNTNSLNSAGE